MRVFLSFLTGALLLFPLPMHGEEGEEILSSVRSVSSSEEEVMTLAVPAEEPPSEACVSGEVSIVTEGGGNGSSFLDVRAEFSDGFSGSECLWNFGDGWQEETCDPSSHTYENVASYHVFVEAVNQCGNTMIQTITVEIGDEIQEEEPGESGGSEVSENLGECGSVFSGISVSEFLPNPTGDEAKEEWIELRNDNAFPVTLCGWQLDDGEGGSKPYAIDGFVIPAQSFQILTRPTSGIALNNDRDIVRLYAPLAPGSSEKILVQSVSYENAPDGSSYASADGGMTFAWTTAPTPNAATIPSKPRVFSHAIVIASALPNPKGTDAGHEWIELYSREDEQVDLSGYVLVRGSQRGTFGAETILPSRQLLRVMAADLALTLPNTDGELALYDPVGMFIASLTWKSAVDDVPVRHVMPDGSRITGRITSVLDENSVELLPLNVPKEFSMYRSLPVTLLGIEIDDKNKGLNFLRALIQGKEIELEFDTKTWNEEGELLGYVYLEDDVLVQEAMILERIAEARTKDDYRLHDFFVSLQRQGENQEGSSSEEVEEIDENSSEADELIVESGYLSATTTEEEKEDFSSYERAEVLITEVYARPKKTIAGDEEWLEIVNISDHSAHLGGFTIEDVTTSKSRVFVFPQGFVVNAGEYAVLPKSLTKLSLNDGGQEIVLRDAEGIERQRMSYPSIKEGISYMSDGEAWCLSSVPSPGGVNACGPAFSTSKLSSVASGVSSKASSSKKPQQSGLSLLKTKFRNIVSGNEESASGAVQESFSDVFAGMTTLDQSMASIDEEEGNGFPKRYFIIVLLTIIGGVLCMYGSRFPLRKGKY